MWAELNAEQRDAVCHSSGPLLILAGAGSGKTRVIAHRIAHLVGQRGVSPRHILAITFTKKAAGEMQSRVESLVGEAVRGMWIGTFHSVCARILRAHADKIGYGPGFTIFDENDQRALMKKVTRELGVSDREFPPARVLEKIGLLKAEMVDPGEFQRLAMTHYDKTVLKLYEAYQKGLLSCNAMDFDDLLVNAAGLLAGRDDVRRRYAERFRHVLIDEYQDTNRAQYRVVAELCRENRDICVVGDDDQSIYGWRGADITNILEFEKSFPEARVIRMEENYRSSRLILEAANSVIRQNKGRKGKTLRTQNQAGDKIVLLLFSTEDEEAEVVAERILSERVRN
ncbi:MAG: UvrD-helicase domain-containing protein, partial [Candidatus Eisenbacteria bacterium]